MQTILMQVMVVQKEFLNWILHIHEWGTNCMVLKQTFNSMFGSECISIRTGLETVKGIRWKLRMIGANLDSPTYIYEDSMSIIHNTQNQNQHWRRKQIPYVTTTLGRQQQQQISAQN